MTVKYRLPLIWTRIAITIFIATWATVVVSNVDAFQSTTTILLKSNAYYLLPTKIPRSVPLSYNTQLYIKSKPPRNKRNQNEEDEDGNPLKSSSSSSWNNLKKLVYDGFDGVSSVLNNKSDDDPNNMANNVQKGKVSQGYNADFMEATARSGRQRMPMSPAERILMKQELGGGGPLGTIRSAGVRSAEQRRQEERDRRESISSFDNFKSGIYGIVDFVTGPVPTRSPKYSGTQDDEEKPSKKNTTTLAVPSKPSFNPIREQEARARATVRNEKIRAEKEDLYKLVDSLQATVDALPETFDAAEDAAKEAISFFKTIPTKVEKTVQELKSIPNKVEQQAAATQKSIQSNVEKTKKVVKDVQDIPNKVNRSVENTKQTLVNTQETISGAVTNVKVLVGLEKPKPKPPRRPPPPQKKPKEIALDLAIKAAGATGKLAWWTGKNAASLAWKGAKVAYDKSMESIGPAMEEAMKQQEERAKQAEQPKLPTIPPPEQTTAAVAGSATSPITSQSTKTPDELSQEVAIAQALAKEVEEALEMAERALLISNLDTDKRPDDLQKLKKK